MGAQAVHLCLAEMLSAMFPILCVSGQHPGGTAGLLRVRLMVNGSVHVCFPRVWASLMLATALALPPLPSPPCFLSCSPLLSYVRTYTYTTSRTCTLLHPHTSISTWWRFGALSHTSAAQCDFTFSFRPPSHSLANPRNILHRDSWSHFPNLWRLDL